MAKRYDATAKSLLEAGPDAWLALAGLSPDGPLSVLDTDVSTVTAAVDGAFRIGGPAPWLAHFEFQTSHDSTLGARLWRYNALLDQHHGAPALCVAILLRPKADGPDLNGIYQRCLPDGRLCHEFHYAVVRVWEVPSRQFLTGGLATLPLAPVADLGGEAVADVLDHIDQRLSREATREQAETLWAATSVLIGLRYPPEFTQGLFQRSRMMDFLKDSTTYEWLREEAMADVLAELRAEGEANLQALVRLEALAKARAEARAKGEAEGRAVEAVRIILKLGRLRFGAPTAETVRAIEAITDVARLEQLSEKLIVVGSWDELLAESRPTDGGLNVEDAGAEPLSS